MNDRSLARLLADLDAELARTTAPGAVAVAETVLTCVEERVPGAVMRSAAGLQLHSLGCRVAPRR